MTVIDCFPTRDPFTRKDLKDHCYRWRDTRCADAAFHFNVVLSNGWKPVDVPAEAPTLHNPLTTLAFFRTLEGPRAEIEVLAAVVTREVAASDWLDLYLGNRGEVVLQHRQAATAGGPVADVLTRSQSPDGPVLSRWLIVKNGSHLFLLQGRAKEADYPRYARTFLLTMSSLRLAQPAEWPLAEALRTYSRRLPGDFLILYPESWELTEDPASHPGYLGVQLTNRIGGVTAGRITLSTLARAAESSAQRLADQLRRELELAGVVVPSVPLARTKPVGGFQAMWQARATAKQGNLELHVTVGQRPDAWFLITLLGPSRKAAGDVWAINQRALAIVLDYLKTA